MSTGTLRQELAHPFSNGVNVSLYRDSANNTLSLEVRDERLRELFTLALPQRPRTRRVPSPLDRWLSSRRVPAASASIGYPVTGESSREPPNFG